MSWTSRKNELTSVCKLLWKQETLLNKHLIMLILAGFFIVSVDISMPECSFSCGIFSLTSFCQSGTHLQI